MNRLVIRADASTRMGTGHVMRCLALAQSWQGGAERGAESKCHRPAAGRGRVLFVCASLPDMLESNLRAEGCDVACIECEPGSEKDMRETLRVTRQWLDDRGESIGLQPPRSGEGRLSSTLWLVADGYQFGAEYQRTIRQQGLRLLLIDDFGHSLHYYADFVLNQNLHVPVDLYAHREHHTRLLLEPKYALLRQQFKPWQNWSRNIAHIACRVLVTLGGSDPDNVTGEVADALRGSDLEVKFVVGGSNPHVEALKARIRELRGSELVVNASDMPSLMAWADVAIAAGGSTSWELAFMGLPSLVLILADNQRAVAEALVGEGVARLVDTKCVAGELSALVLDVDSRQRMSERGRALVDGEGAARVSACLRSIAISLRPVQSADCRLIWEWANEAETRAASLSSDPIPWATHEAWFAARLQATDCLFYVATSEGVPIGQIRFDDALEESVLSFSLAKEARGQGHGPALILAGVQRYFAEKPVRSIRARVKPDNPASVRAFVRAGFSDAGETETGGYRVREFVLRRGDGL